jgi:DNA-binding transcriptional LysR family regulator
MELRQLATFRAVATHLNFTRAATALDYAQSSVTAQIQLLEEELGLPLFDRMGRRVMLTEAGERLVWYADKMLELAQQAKAAIAGEDVPSGSLTISAPETICTYRLPSVLQRFRKSYPQVGLTFKPTSSNELRRSVSQGTLEVAFVLEEPFEVSNLNVEPLVEEPVIILAPPDHPLARKKKIDPCELEGEPLLMTEAGCAYRVLFKRALAEAGVQANITLEFDSIEAIKQCVIAGLGLTILPKMAVRQELANGSLVELEWTGREMKVVLQMIWHRDKWISPALNAFLSHARNSLKQ